MLTEIMIGVLQIVIVMVRLVAHDRNTCGKTLGAEKSVPCSDCESILVGSSFSYLVFRRHPSINIRRLHSLLMFYLTFCEVEPSEKV